MPTSAAPRARPVVLHVTESLGGGVSTAIADLAVAVPDHEHHLLAARRPGHDTGARLGDAFSTVQITSPGVLALSVALRRRASVLQPDVVHLHSSWAGVLGRVLLPRPHRVVYTPHCYAFEREDLPPWVRAVVRAVERALARRCAAVAACSPREAELARSLGSKAVLVPNVPPDLRRQDVSRRKRTGGGPVVAGVGRLAPQKAPSLFADVAELVRAARPGVQFMWIGGGDLEEEAALTSRGVEVTGWTSREDGLERLAAADLYLHTAAWEGSPMTLLEAASLGVPVVVRSIAATTALGYPPGLTTAADLAHAVVGVLEGASPPPGPAELPSRREQVEGLRRAYALVIG